MNYKNFFIINFKILDYSNISIIYSDFFSKYPRNNSMSKIFYLLDLIMNDFNNDTFHAKKMKFIKEFYKLYYIKELSYINFNKKISWENKELYLYNFLIIYF